MWCVFFFFKQKTAYEMRISDWSSDVCSSDLVVDIGEVALHPAVVEDGDRLTRQDFRGEDPHRHVRTAPGAIDGEEAQAGPRDAEEMGVGFAHQFVGA